MSWLKRPRVAAAVGAAVSAVVGTVGTRPRTAWYLSLRKPSWQPPPDAFPIVWTPLYASIGWAGGQALESEKDPVRRKKLAAVLAADLAVNAGFCWAFFVGRSTVAGLATQGALNVLNADLVRRSWQADRRAGLALLPYSVWCVFATALNAKVWSLNRGRRG